MATLKYETTWCPFRISEAVMVASPACIKCPSNIGTGKGAGNTVECKGEYNAQEKD
jgi:hypothetical protein